MSDHLLGGVVRWLDALDPHEGPERVGVLEQVRARLRLLSRKTPISRATAATTPGPKLPVGTPAGSLPKVTWPQLHPRAWSWYSSKNGSSFGRSNTWWRCGLGSRPSSPRWHFSQRMGRQAMIERAFSDGSNGRDRRACPGCPPGFRPLGGFFGRGGVAGPSLDGGFDELRDDLPRASFSARTSA